MRTFRKFLFVRVPTNIHTLLRNSPKKNTEIFTRVNFYLVIDNIYVLIDDKIEILIDVFKRILVKILNRSYILKNMFKKILNNCAHILIIV